MLNNILFYFLEAGGKVDLETVRNLDVLRNIIIIFGAIFVCCYYDCKSTPRKGPSPTVKTLKLFIRIYTIS